MKLKGNPRYQRPVGSSLPRRAVRQAVICARRRTRPAPGRLIHDLGARAVKEKVNNHALRAEELGGPVLTYQRGVGVRTRQSPEINGSVR